MYRLCVTRYSSNKNETITPELSFEPILQRVKYTILRTKSQECTIKIILIYLNKYIQFTEENRSHFSQCTSGPSKSASIVYPSKEKVSAICISTYNIPPPNHTNPQPYRLLGMPISGRTPLASS